MATSNDAHIIGVLGQSGQGKGLFIKHRLKTEAPTRLMVWDAMNEYEEFAPAIPTLTHFLKVTLGKKNGAFKARYIPKGNTEKALNAEFVAFCTAALAAGNCTVVVEELSFVTRASVAPRPWAKLCNAGRHAGIRLYAASQFPAQVDKAFMSNCTELISFYLGEKPHREAVAEKMDIEPEQIKALQKFNYLHFLRDARTVSPGIAPLPGGRVGQVQASVPVTSPNSDGRAVPQTPDESQGFSFHP